MSNKGTVLIVNTNCQKQQFYQVDVDSDMDLSWLGYFLMLLDTSHCNIFTAHQRVPNVGISFMLVIAMISHIKL